MANSKDLFNDTTMSFGEHLEVLRIHLWKALIGLAVCVVFALYFGDSLIAVVRKPVDEALQRHGQSPEVQETDDSRPLNYLKTLFAAEKPGAHEAETPEKSQSAPVDDSQNTVTAQVRSRDLLQALHQSAPQQFPAPDEKLEDRPIEIQLSSNIFQLVQDTAEKLNRPVTLTVQEAFLTYLKVSFISGFVIASPWVFYQMWLFVAAGLYPHERRYIHLYLPISIILFVGGATFCFFVVFPFVLDFLLTFNSLLEVVPQIRLSEWISFAVMLPLMFGLSFQLPLIMLFLERISVFEVKDYREKRRLAILTIAIISMFMTPADPASMILMMIPLLLLYELGIWMCGFSAAKSPFGAEAA